METTTLVSKKKISNIDDTVIKDEDGYYKILLGGFNTYNRSGIYYRIKDPNSLLENNTILRRRVTEGTLRSEEEHPVYNGMNNNEIISRTIFLDSTRVCGHIKSVIFVDTGRCEKGWDGYNITYVYGWVKPTGPFGNILKEQLDNPNENVAFSVRSLVKQKYIGTTLVRDVLDVSTWDHVFEGGIAKANQWAAAGIESIKDDIGICLDGVCKNDIKKMISGNEHLSCEDGQCLLNVVDTIEAKPDILKW